MTVYKDFQGNKVFVSPGISSGNVWMTVKQKPGKTGTKRVVTKNLPLRDTREAAQADLDRWAYEHKLEVLRTCRICGYTVYDGGRFWVENEDLCNMCEGGSDADGNS